MPDDETPTAAEAPLSPDEVANQSFPTAFRGFDPVAVRAFLGLVADELARLHDRHDEPGRAEETAGDGDVPVDDGTELLATAQAEADRLVREARERVATLGSAATAEATRVLEEARVEAARIRAGATDQLRSRVEEAETTAVRRIAEAEREAASIRVKAREEADEIVEAAKQRGREMVSEAQAARERMLADLAKRRRAVQAQLDQLRTSRDRLLDTLKVARRNIDEVTTRFDAADAGSGAAGPTASAALPSPPATITTTPPAAAPGRAGRGAGASPPDAGDRDEPPRTAVASKGRAVVIGETPEPAARPQIAAPRAAAAQPAGVAETTPSAAHEPAPAHSEERPPAASGRTEERRSSALRILRRNRGSDRSADVPPLIGRESSGEGVRIIGRTAAPPAEPAPAAIDPPVADAAEEPAHQVAPPVASAPPPVELAPLVVEPVVPRDEPVHDERVADDHGWDEPLAGAEPEAVVPEEALAPRLPATPPAPGPGGREEIRATIDDLFARIRADRATAVSTAREVLATADPGTSSGHAGTPELPEPSGSPVFTEEADAALGVADEQWLQVRDAAVDPLAAQLTRRLKRALQDEQNASLDGLRTSRGRPEVDALLPPPSDQAAPYQQIARPFLEEAARAGAARSPFGTLAFAVDDLAGHLADDLAGAVRSRLRQVVDAGADDLASLIDGISAVYREWKIQKVERLATHYLVAAHERGAFVGHSEGTPLRWLVDDDGNCPDCDDNALAGPTPRGETYPTGQLHPPAHLGCRCSLAPATA